MKTRIILLTVSLSVCSVWAADLSGVWKAQFDTQRGLQKYTFTLQQDGTKITGHATAEVNDAKRESELKEGKIEGDIVSFVEPLNIQGNDLRITYTGKISGNEIKFTRQVGDFSTTKAVAKRESATAQSASAAKMVRIKAGKSEPIKDAEGNVWLADQGFEGGETIERPDIQIANTKSPDLYRAERYSMNSFSWPVPNGKYVVKLHFAETFDGITGPGQRVFSFNVQGHEFKDFDVWVKAGGPLRAYVETVNVEATDSVIKATFTPNVENPQINAIEIIPQATAEAGAPAPVPKTIRIKAGKSEPVKDAEGNVWLADQGFEGGETIERPDIQIANTKSPDLYRAERYSMNSFSWPVPNGKYIVKLHFAETFDGITGPGQRVFSFNVQGHEFKDFDVWVKAGGPLRAFVETVNVEATDGVIKVTFTPNVENPQINAIEIIPQTTDASGAASPSSAASASQATASSVSATAISQTTSATSASGPVVLQIDEGKVTGTVSPTLYGLMTEEINFSYEGGLYAELIRNRTFKANAQNPIF